MNWLKKSFASPYISWRFIEWILIFGDLLVLLLSSNPYAIRPYRFELHIVFTTLFFLLSFIFPINRPVEQKRWYIAAEISFIFFALLLPINLDILMYFILAKACFLLPRKDAAIAIIITGIANLFAYIWVIPKFYTEAREYIKTNGTEELFPPVSEIILQNFIEYTVISFFLTLIMFLLVAESKSRKRAERLAQEVEILATVVERNRIARDIHDSLGHTLTTLGVQLELAQKLHGINSEKASQALKNAQQLAHQSLTEVRNTVTTIRNENFNLEKALNNFLEQFKKDNPLKIQIQLDLNSIPLKTSYQVYCIIKESLYNIQKHSKADLVTINSETNDRNIIIEIADNGIGFNPQKINSGSGIPGMIERSRIINSQLNIDTAPDRGTRIQLKIPVEH
ncbi:MAG: sensor histidine kinase [Pleurocapsa sp.]